LIDYSKYDDKQLIGFISLEGNEKEFAFKEIYFRYAKRIYSHCKLKCTDEHEAKDMHQEIWMIFFQAIKDGKTDLKLPHYLYGIARNIYLQNCKKHNKQTIINEDKFEIDSIISPYISLEASIEEQDLIKIIKMASEYLNEPLKETFHLKWFSGLPNNEIAEITGESVDNIKQRSHRSMTKILKILSPFIKDFQK
jgi:RNA polymerase sigma-70 factor (ECF subfamily)